jgi:hypothetical protein
VRRNNILAEELFDIWIATIDKNDLPCERHDECLHNDQWILLRLERVGEERKRERKGTCMLMMMIEVIKQIIR